MKAGNKKSKPSFVQAKKNVKSSGKCGNRDSNLSFANRNNVNLKKIKRKKKVPQYCETFLFRSLCI